ncbi:MAG: T9SS type A sorting domain-containing protein [Bacteroidales bacterium]|nr:T9SS type A sorting domain-containing protein [Bacteroidales bacterium]
MYRKWLIYILLLISVVPEAFPQEVVTGLLHNYQLGNTTDKTFLKGSKGTDTLLLPFYDDFSGGTPFPSSLLWADRDVFVNNTYSTNQVSQGVATFDCLDEYGELYETASTGIFSADTLTSRPINLLFSPVDSIILSFLYEAGGVADLPERDDSLTLRFWAPEEEKWYSIWSAEGESTQGFRQVIIPVEEARYLKKGFRFMFTGHASLSGITTEPSRAGNADHWNLDHVMLDKGRSVHDTVLHDVALTYPLRSLVKEYYAMPWRHFRQSYLSMMSPTVAIKYRNNDTIVRNVTREVSIKDLSTNTVVREFSAGATNVPPLTDISFDAPLLYTFNSSTTDTALFLVTVSLITDDFDPKNNDTIRFTQRFSDYFALDDGTAEAGYGVNGQGARSAMVALKYRSYFADSVRAISICFNDAYDNANRRAFDIMVWADDNGKPGVLLGKTDGPVATPADALNGFKTYPFDKPVSVNGTFWIGWKQYSETFLNAGLDMNTPHDGKQYFLLTGNWEQSQAPGTVMMRPVMKGEGTTSSSDDNPLINNMFMIYPNPTNGPATLLVSDDAPDDFIMEVLSSTGKRVMSVPRNDHPDFSSLAGGTYLLIIKDIKGKPLSLLRLIKVN